jgi:hypothetical protein
MAGGWFPQGHPEHDLLPHSDATAWRAATQTVTGSQAINKPPSSRSVSRAAAHDRPNAVAKKIQEIVYDVEAGQLAPWKATKRLLRLFDRLHRAMKVDKSLDDHRAIL